MRRILLHCKCSEKKYTGAIKVYILHVYRGNTCARDSLTDIQIEFSLINAEI